MTRTPRPTFKLTLVAQHRDTLRSFVQQLEGDN